MPIAVEDHVLGLLRSAEEGDRPLFPGAVCGLDLGTATTVVDLGWAYRYSDAAGTLLPAESARRVQPDTLFDLASLTKLFTATVIVQLAERGALTLDDPLERYFDSYATSSARRAVTVRHLLTHASGLPADNFCWRTADGNACRTAVLHQELEATPGSRSRYSCVGFLTLGFLIEQVCGRRLAEAVDELICQPLGLRDTSYQPLDRGSAASPPVAKDRIAATEMRRIDWSPRHDPDDPDPRGVVHDENAARLAGVAGNAGLFGTAADLLAFGRSFLGVLAGGSSALGLSASAVREMVTPQRRGIGTGDYQFGLGFRIDDRSFMGALAGSGQAYGHPGFTGTSLVIDEARDLVLVLLSNRVHPSRTWSELNPFRRRLADLVAATAAPGLADRR